MRVLARSAFSDQRCSLLLVIIASLMTIVAAADQALAGNGTFKDGMFSFCVSVRFSAMPAEIAKIKARFEAASQILADATDDQHRFGTVTFVNDSGASQTADYWIHAGSRGASAAFNGYGVRGKHVNLWFDRHFTPTDPHTAEENVYTIAHEFAHFAYGVRDEYLGLPDPVTAPPDCAPCAEEALTLNYCFMDNYKDRGGEMGTPPMHTLNEFCVSSNHDSDTDTDQHREHMQSCWETIAAHTKYPATAPLTLPTSAPPAAHTIQTKDGIKGVRAMLLLDRSGSMGAEMRLDFAKSGAKLFVDVFKVGDRLGVASFSSLASVNFPLTVMTGPGACCPRAAAKAAIDAITADGATNIGGGLLTALGEITAQPERSCNEIIVLLSDGDHNTGTPPAAVIPTLNEENVTVFTVGVGAGISNAGVAELQNIANQTGGRFFRVGSASDLPALFILLSKEASGTTGLLGREPLEILSGEVLEIPVFVEADAEGATFALTIADDLDDVVLSLRTPLGEVIDGSGLSVPNGQVFEINNPEAGVWTMVVAAGVINTGLIEVLAFADHDGVQLTVLVRRDNLVFPEAMEIEATPTFGGENVVGAEVTGTVIRPNGSEIPITLFDDGSAENGDDIAGDGVYSTIFSCYDEDGTYTVKVTSVNNTGVTYIGEPIEVLPEDEATAVPPFDRVGFASAVVSGVLEPCPWDCGATQNGIVDVPDLLALLVNWGTPGPCDFDGDGAIAVPDLLALLANWGPCPGCSSGGAPTPPLQEEIENAGLTMDDWDDFEECMMEAPQAEADNCLCWMDHYLGTCTGEICDPDPCPDDDPFGGPHLGL